MAEQGRHLYFIKIARGRDPVKIGRANNPEERLKCLQVASPYKLRLLGTLDGCGDSEFDFHHYLQKSRMLGEWFKWSSLVEQTVKMALGGGDWRTAIAEQPRDPTDENWEWWIGSPLYAGNPKYPQFQAY